MTGRKFSEPISQAPEAGGQPESVQKVSLEQSSAPSAEVQSNIAAQDKASQQEALSDNLKTGTEVVPFEVFGQTQEAINGALPHTFLMFLAVGRETCACEDLTSQSNLIQFPFC